MSDYRVRVEAFQLELTRMIEIANDMIISGPGYAVAGMNEVTNALVIADAELQKLRETVNATSPR